MATSRELKRLDATTKSPIFASFQVCPSLISDFWHRLTYLVLRIGNLGGPLHNQARLLRRLLDTHYDLPANLFAGHTDSKDDS